MPQHEIAHDIAASGVTAPDAAGRLSAELDEVELSTWESPALSQERATLLEHQAEAMGEEQLRLRALLVLADVRRIQGETVASGRLLRWVNRWAVEHENRYLQARSHRLLGTFFEMLGDDVSCLEHCIKSVDLLIESDRPALRADHLLSLGIAQGRIGATDEARASFNRSEELVERLGDHYRHMMVLNNLAYLEHEAGDHDTALMMAERMVALADIYGVELISAFRDTLARIYLEDGRHAQAEEVMLRVVDEAFEDEWSDANAVAEYALTLTEVQRRRGLIADATATLDRCRRLCDDRSLHGVLAKVHREQAELYAAENRFDEAFAEYKHFHETSQKLNSDARLSRARTLQTVFDFEEARKASARFEEMALRDPLTGLYNRRFVDATLPGMLGSATDGDAPISVAFIDLDHFKRINDDLSHSVGDEVLQTMARLLAAAAPHPGFAARMGGEEFLIVQPGVDHPRALITMGALQDEVRAFDWEPLVGTLPVRASIGLTTARARQFEQFQLLELADRNLYAAKEQGRDRVVAIDESLTCVG